MKYWKYNVIVVAAILTCVFGNARSQGSSTLSTPRITAPRNGTHISTAITLQWSPVDGAKEYEVRVLIAGLTDWRDTIVGTTAATIHGFLGGVDYYAHVRAISDRDTTAWSGEDFYFTADLIGVNEPERTPLLVYPNPVNTNLCVSGTASGEVSLYNELGLRVADNASLYGDAHLDTHSLPPGNYWLVRDADRSILQSVQVRH